VRRALKFPYFGSKAAITDDSSPRLLGVFHKLQGVGAAVRDEEVQNQLIDQARGLIEDICSDHVRAARQFIKNDNIQNTLVEEVQKECQELIEYIVAAKRFNLEVNSRSKDRVISFGEKLSCHFMTSLLHDEVSLLCYLTQYARVGPTNHFQRGLRRSTLISPMLFTSPWQDEWMHCFTMRPRRPCKRGSEHAVRGFPWSLASLATCPAA